MAGPLTGIKILDLSRILAGPWATQTLADYGADVIKVERPKTGDDTRHWGPPYLANDVGEESGESAYFLSANRGKRSICVDFTRAEGQQIIRQLSTNSDILVENFKVGGLKAYGLDYASLSKHNPRLIYCSITGFGQTGPYAGRAGYDAIIQAMGGLMSITGEADEIEGGGPQKVGVAVADLMTGMYAVSAITAALYSREKTGLGQHIDLSLFDTQVAWLANQNMNYLVGNEIPQRHGSAHPNIVPYQAVKSKDGHFMLAVGNDSQFEKFCHVIQRPDLIDNVKFASNQRRVANRTELIGIIEQVLCTQPSHYWLQQLEIVKVPCGPINNIEEVFQDPQIQARKMQFALPQTADRQVPQVANPVKFSDTQIQYQKAPPLLGEDTNEILGELGFDEAAMQKLKQQGIT